MIARIIPLKRLPKNLHYFDYTVPEELTQTIQVGQLVTIPLRKSTIFGLVFDLAETGTSKASKEISSIAFQEALVHASFLTFLHTQATIYGVSTSTLAKQSILPLQKRKLQNVSLKKLPHIPERSFTSNFIHYRTQEDSKTILPEHIKGATLILVPEVHHIERIKALLPDDMKERTTSWYSGLSIKEQFSRWLEIRNGEKNIIIGTRSAVFLAFPSLDTIIIDHEHDEQHKQWDGSPRFHVHDIAEDLQKIYKANLIKTSFVPSVQAYYDIQMGRILLSDKQVEKGTVLFNHQDVTNTVVIDSTREPGSKYFSAIIERIEQGIMNAVEEKKDIFLFINRKGFAPAGSKEEQVYGIGTETVEAELKQLLTKHSYTISRIEKDTDVIPESDTPRAIVGTTTAFKHIRWERTGCIAYLDIDRQIAIPEFGSLEQAWCMIQKARFLMAANCKLYIQTRNPDHYLFKSLKEPDRFYRMELQGRKAFSHPPYSYLTRYIYKGTAYSAQDTYKEVQRLTETMDSVTVSNLIAIQAYDKPLVAMVARMSKRDHAILRKISKNIPPDWIVDPRPTSLSHP